MSLQVTVKISGDTELTAKLTKLGTKLVNFMEANKSIGKEVAAYYGGQVFASQGAELGKRWASLSPNYKRYKAKKYPGRGLNVVSGHMQKGFTYEATTKQVVIFNEVSKESVPYFDFIQLGTRKMPARPMLGINEPIKTIIADIVNIDIANKIREAGL